MSKLSLLKKVKGALDEIVRRFKAGEIYEVVAVTIFPRSDVPSSVWSFRNRLLMAIAGTADARGFKQWKKVGRNVKKGSKAFYILAPLSKKVGEDDNGESVFRLTGFREVAVFRFEDTEGDELETPNLPELPALPFAEVAERFGLEVRPGYFDGNSLGFFRPSENLIELHTDDVKVWLHELAHAAHLRAIGEDKFRKNSYSKNEVVAETVALTLAVGLGRGWDLESGSSARYLSGYSNGDSPIDAILSVLDEVEKTISLIFATEEEVKVAA